MSTKTYSVENSTKNTLHSDVAILHGARGHNRTISGAVLPYQLSAALLAHSALCELKFH